MHKERKRKEEGVFSSFTMFLFTVSEHNAVKHCYSFVIEEIY